MAETNANLWAPWRMEYIRSLGDDSSDDGCFLCRYADNPAEDKANHVLWRSRGAMVVMNRFPYTNGHLMVALTDHRAELTDLTEDELTQLTIAIRDSIRVLRDTIKPQGFNVGYNIGQCAGAGLPGHLHAHIVPRWGGDTNFMAVLGDVRVVPDALDALYLELVTQATAMGLRAE